MAPHSRRAARSSSPNSSGTLLPFTKRTLGDKLQRLAELSPSYVRDLEVLVDRILARLETSNPCQTDPPRHAG